MIKDRVYKIPIENADEYYLDFFSKFEKKYPFFEVIKHYVKKIIIEYVPEMSKKDVVMLYLNNNIYISPTLKNLEYLREGLIHEIGHILLSRSELQNNEKLKDEFFYKRKVVLQNLMQDYKVPQRIQDLFKNLEEFSIELDDYLNKTITYENMSQYIEGCFLDSYAISSFDEYLATGFEMYFSEYKESLKITNPILYANIDKLLEKF